MAVSTYPAKMDTTISNHGFDKGVFDGSWVINIDGGVTVTDWAAGHLIAKIASTIATWDASVTRDLYSFVTQRIISPAAWAARGAVSATWNKITSNVPGWSSTDKPSATWTKRAP